MQMILKLLCIIGLISFLSGCMSNVVPQRGATMEQIYDSVGRERNRELMMERQNKVLLQQDAVTLPVKSVVANNINSDFKKLPNPELKMYVFPHLAGNDDVPIPGYYTVFNVYEHDHYIPKNQWIKG